MATIIPSQFTSYVLSEKEELAGGLLTIDQKQLIQNDRANVATQLLSLEYDPSKPMEFLQQDAYLKAQLQCFTFLLDRSNECEKRYLSGSTSPTDE